METKANTQYQMTKPVRIVWPHVTTPKPGNKQLGNEPRYEATFLFTEDSPDLAAIKQMMAAVVKEKLGNTEGRKFPLARGDKLADDGAAKNRDREFLRGFTLLSAHANVTIKVGPKKGEALQPPRLVVLQNGQFVRYWEPEERQLASKFFYSGVLGIGTFTFVAYEGMGGGVSAYLNEILSLNTGDRINTGIDDAAKYGNAEAYSAYIGKASNINPAAGADDISY